MKQPFTIRCQYLAPQILLSRFAGFMANIQLPWLKNRLIQFFLSRHPVNLSEAIEEDPYKYKSFHDFFTRELKPNVRHFAHSPHTVCSPVDGILSQFGSIENEKLIQAKGHDYPLEKLLAKNDHYTDAFRQGSFATIYLAPKHYHRVHMPIDGRLLQLRYVPGRLFSVNIHTSEHVPELFCQNERAILIFETTLGKMAVIFVGAMIVGNIFTRFTGSLTAKRTQNKPIYIDYPNNDTQHIQVNKGDDIGHFTLGSTVIMLTEKQAVNWGEQHVGKELMLGEALLTS